MSKLKHVGKSILREDAFERVNGEVRYLDDFRRDNMLYAKLVLSKRGHADFTIDKTEALKVKGVVAIYTSEDVPEVQYNSSEWYPGNEGIRDERILNERALYYGDRIAMVVGESKHAVEKAISRLVIHYVDLPAVIGLENAKKDETIIKFDTNKCYERTIEYGAIDEAFASADLIIEDAGYTPKTHHTAIENHICMAEVDEFGNLVVWTPCQIIFGIQMHICRILGLPRTKVRVIKAPMGGSFGGKQQPILEPPTAFAANMLKRPVLLYMDRADCIAGTVSRNAMEIQVETAVSKEGKILGRRVVTDVDGGAYDTNSTAVTNAFAKKLFRLYDIPSQYFHGEVYFTNTIPGGACRAYGGPQAHAVSEVHMDHLASELGMDPCEFRLLNLVDPYAEDPTGGPNLGNAKIKDCVRLGMEDFNWKHKRSHIKEKDTDRYAHGVGMAAATHGNGYTGAFPDFTNIEMVMNDDESVLIKMAVHEQGCGTLTTMQQIAAETLNTEPENIRILEADSFMTPYDSAGTQASRVTFVNGGAIKEAGELLLDKMMDTLVELEGFDKSQLYTEDGKICEKGTDRFYTYGQIVKMREKRLNDSTLVFLKHTPKGNPASFACFFAEVKIDKYTGMVQITDALAVHDVGQSVNPQLVEGQIQGGAYFSIGMALTEEMEYRSDGVLTNPSLSKYHVLNAVDMPYVKVLTIEEGDKTAPFGVKAVGEMSAVAPAPAVMNAINHALGSNNMVFPATPERILDIIQQIGE
ncbi:MAG: molybdopterin-dependent oxidoreductase [Tissierellia bacterium]|nr:molybdopterin-dependent oxidoreductase [Tissierellia bacterium]